MKNIFYIAILLVASLILFACNTAHTHEEEAEEAHEHHEEVLLTQQQYDALQMKLGIAKKRNMSGYIPVNGKLAVPPQNRAAITSAMGANITQIKTREGDKIVKGQALAYLAHPSIISMQTDYLNAFSHRNFVKQNFERQQKLYEAGVTSGLNYQKAKAEYETTKAAVKGLEAQLKLLNINTASVRKGTIFQSIALRSPMNGHIQQVNVRVGQYVEPQTEIIEIVDTKNVHADFMVFEKDVDKIHKGQKIIFTLQNSNAYEYIAHIESIGKNFEENPKAIHIHAEIKNKNKPLIPGMYLEGKIITDSIKIMALPENAVIKEGEKYFAFKAIKEDDKWAFVPEEVMIGETVNGYTAVRFLEKFPADTQFALNNAYYLIAELKKGEAEHSH